MQSANVCGNLYRSKRGKVLSKTASTARAPEEGERGLPGSYQKTQWSNNNVNSAARTVEFAEGPTPRFDRATASLAGVRLLSHLPPSVCTYWHTYIRYRHRSAFNRRKICWREQQVGRLWNQSHNYRPGGICCFHMSLIMPAKCERVCQECYRDSKVWVYRNSQRG